MIFHKSSSAGNDFLIMEKSGLKDIRGNISEFANNACGRKNGPGADGLIVYEKTGEHIEFSIFNSDGSEAEISGNGMGGLSALLFSLGKNKKGVSLETRAGRKAVKLTKREGHQFHMEIEIGEPDFFNLKFFPFLKKGKSEYSYDGIKFFPVSVGNPHAVIFPDTLPDGEEMMKIGKKFEKGSIFPLRTNVEFVLPAKDTHPDSGPFTSAFFYERGAGKTSHPSTGSAAIFAVMRNSGLIKENLTIENRGGNIRIWGKNRIYIENCTKIVYKGDYFYKQ